MKLKTILIIAGAAGAVGYTGYHLLKMGKRTVSEPTEDTSGASVYKQYWKYWKVLTDSVPVINIDNLTPEEQELFKPTTTVVQITRKEYQQLKNLA